MDKKLLIILLLNVVLFLIVRSQKLNKGWHNIAVFAFTALITLTAVECVYRFFIKKNSYLLVGNEGFRTYIPNNVAGYTLTGAGKIRLDKITARGDTVYKAEYTIIPDTGSNTVYTYHRIGFRSNRPDSGKTNEIVFLGCSITYGEGINDSATFAYKTGKLCNTSSVNLALSGYGTHQAYHIYVEKYIRHPDNKKRVFVYSFIPDHILRAKCVYPWSSGDPYYSVKGDSLHYEGKAFTASGYARTNKALRYASLFYTFTFVSDIVTTFVLTRASQHVTPEDYQRPMLMLADMQRTMSQHNNRFVIVYWDKYIWNGHDDERVLSRQKIEKMISAVQSEGADVIRASEILDLNDPANFILHDGHPTARANALIAAAIARAVCNNP